MCLNVGKAAAYQTKAELTGGKVALSERPTVNPQPSVLSLPVF